MLEMVISSSGGVRANWLRCVLAVISGDCGALQHTINAEFLAVGWDQQRAAMSL